MSVGECVYFWLFVVFCLCSCFIICGDGEACCNTGFKQEVTSTVE